MNSIYGNKYRIRLDHQILTDHSVFYPHALYNNLVFELILAPASPVARGSDASKLLQLEYEMIRSKVLADEADRVLGRGKEFAYDHIMWEEVVSFAKNTDRRLDIRVNPQRRSLKATLLLFIEPYKGDARESEKYFTKVQASPK